MKKKVLSLILSLMMIMTMMPYSALADDTPVTNIVESDVAESKEQEPSSELHKEQTDIKQEGETSKGSEKDADQKEGELLQNPSQDSAQTTSSERSENAVLPNDTKPAPVLKSEPAVQNGVYQIETEEQLKWFAKHVNSDKANYSAKAVLVKDIELTGEWTPIGGGTGYATLYFSGSFDGQGHRIQGLSLNVDYDHAGLFGYVKGAEIKNLIVEGANVSSSKNNVGGIVGTLASGTIENVSFSGQVSSTSKRAYAGGIVGASGLKGESAPSIKNSANYASVSGNTAGGIAGEAKYTQIKDVYNTGNIQGTQFVGGIAGKIANDTTIQNSYSIGEVVGEKNGGSIIGFIVGNSTISYSYWLSGEKGFNGNASNAINCEKITTPEDLLSKLNEQSEGVWAKDSHNINKGYPVLVWQGGEPIPPDTTPSIKISGKSTLYVDKKSGDDQTTFTAVLKNIPDEQKIIWSIKSKDGKNADHIATLTEIDNDNRSVVLKAVKGGIAVVTASTTVGSEEIKTEKELMVIPEITGATIHNIQKKGAVAIGQTVTATVNIKGGGEYTEKYPPLTYNWYKRERLGSSYTFVGNSNTFKIPATFKEWDHLHLEVLSDGKALVKKDNAKQSVRSEDYGILYPVVYDEDFPSLPTKIRKEKKLTLPASHSKDGIEATIEWSSDKEAIISKEGVVKLPDQETKVTLAAKFTYNKAYANRFFEITVYPKGAPGNEDLDLLENAKKALGPFYKLSPKFTQDSNLIEMVKADLAKKGFKDIGVSVKKIETTHDGSSIAEDGKITYFYKHPSEVISGLKFGQHKIDFELTKGNSKATLENINVTVPWDIDRVKEVMREEVLSKVISSTILGENPDPQNITSNMTLPKNVADKKWVNISWMSSNPAVIKISDGTWDQPATVSVNRTDKDEKVNLIATFKFIHSSDNEPAIELHKTFNLIVKAQGDAEADAIRKELLDILNKGFEKVGIRDFATNRKLQPQNDVYTIHNDILIPRTSEFEVDGKYFPITMESSNEDLLSVPDIANAARGWVYRPAVGEESQEVTLTVSITHKEKNVSASKQFSFEVQPLKQEEIAKEIALMEKVKAAYFEGIKGENDQADHITKNLRSFQEVYENTKNELVWVRDIKDRTNQGIIPVDLIGWYDAQQWRLFRSSNSAVVSHENLLVHRQKDAKAVTIDSALSSYNFGRYGELYAKDPVKYKKYEALAPLYYQEVHSDLVVRGTQNPGSSAPVVEKINVSFTLQSANSTWIQTVALNDLAEGTTVFDVFKKILEEKGYRYNVKGSYVYEIIAPDGTSLKELKEGPNSGWMYKVNGVIADKYMSGYVLKNNDKIVVFFTKDYTQEQGYPGGSSGSFGGGGGSAPTNVQKQDPPKETELLPYSMPLADAENHWAKEAVAFVAQRGLLRTIDGKSFAPDLKMTRAMFVTVLFRLDGEPKTEYKNAYSDVKPDLWYSESVNWASAHQIVKGLSKNTFGVQENITREQLAVFMMRYAQHKGLDISERKDLSMYQDIGSDSIWAKDALSWASAKGLLSGRAQGKMEPKANATRAEVASILMRFTKLLEAK